MPPRSLGAFSGMARKRKAKPASFLMPATRAAYTRRLDILFGPGGWTQSFSMTTVSNIQRSKKINKAYAMITTGKILVTSTITLEGFGTRSSTGEGWADDENGTTRAQAQAFRRACAELGLGRYLRELEGSELQGSGECERLFQTPALLGASRFRNPPFRTRRGTGSTLSHCEIITEANGTSDGCSDSQRQSTYTRRSIVGAGCTGGGDNNACFWFCAARTYRSTNGGCSRHRNPARGVADP